MENEKAAVDQSSNRRISFISIFGYHLFPEISYNSATLSTNRIGNFLNYNFLPVLLVAEQRYPASLGTVSVKNTDYLVYALSRCRIFLDGCDN